MNRVMLAGNIATDIELKKFDSGKKASFTVAINSSYYDKEKEERVKKTDFIRIVSWGNTAETISKHFEKGNGIILECQLKTRKYEDDSGNAKTIMDVVAVNFYFPPSSGKKKKDDDDDGGSKEKKSKKREDEDGLDDVYLDDGYDDKPSKKKEESKKKSGDDDLDLGDEDLDLADLD